MFVFSCLHVGWIKDFAVIVPNQVFSKPENFSCCQHNNFETPHKQTFWFTSLGRKKWEFGRHLRHSQAWWLYESSRPWDQAWVGLRNDRDRNGAQRIPLLHKMHPSTVDVLVAAVLFYGTPNSKSAGVSDSFTCLTGLPCPGLNWGSVPTLVLPCSFDSPRRPAFV